MNEIIALAKKSHYSYNAEKRKWAKVIQLYALEQGFQPITEPAFFEFEHLEPNRRRDPDNFSSGAQKFVFDALQEAGLLKNDGWNEILAISHVWKVSEEVGVKLTVR